MQLIASGDLSELPVSTRRALEKASADLAHNDGMILNLCLNYGGRDEIVRVVKRFAEDVLAGRIEPVASCA